MLGFLKTLFGLTFLAHILGPHPCPSSVYVDILPHAKTWGHWPCQNSRNVVKQKVQGKKNFVDEKK